MWNRSREEVTVFKLFSKKSQLTYLLPHPKEILLVLWERNWPLLGIFPGPSMPSYLGESSLPLFLALKIYICTSSFPKDEVTDFQRLSWDLKGSAMPQCRSAPGLWAPSWAILNILLWIAPSLPMKMPNGGREPHGETLSPCHCLLASEPQDFQMTFPDAVIQLSFWRQMAFR